MIRMRPVGGAWVTMPTPSSFKPSKKPVSKAERASNADMFIELIAYKTTLAMAWAYLTPALCETLFDMVIDNLIVEIEYPDPKDNALVTKLFYTSDKDASLLNYTDSTSGGWTDVTFNAIQI